MDTNYKSKHIGHLGLVSGMIDELGLVEEIDKCLDSVQGGRKVSIGTLCKALIINGLGFTQRTLYMVSSFFEDKAIEQLLGEGIKSSELNDTVLGRCLDTVHDYGCTALYAQLAPVICKKLGLQPKSVHMDSTDFHLDGVYNSGEESVGEQLVHLKRGYSRDHRPDLNQVVLNLIVDNHAGIVLHMQGLDGNSSDKKVFNKTINDHIGQLQSATDFGYIVTDSAGYTEQSIKDCGTGLKWISRVPETIGQSKGVLLGAYDNWGTLSDNYQYVPLRSSYAGIEQRWLLVFSEEAYHREIKTLRRKYQKASEKEFKLLGKLEKELFDCKEDAEKAAGKLIKKFKYLTLSKLDIKTKAFYLTKGRPKKDQKPDGYKYFIETQSICELSGYQKRAKTKGRFIIATNEQDEAKLSDEELFSFYKKQSKVERGFRFLKDPQFMASTFFVKKPERVEALLFIMTLCLTVYAALEHKIRQQLKETNQTVPNQIKKEVANPSARWIFALFNNIQVLYRKEQQIVLNIKEVNLKVLELLGSNYKKYYLLI